MGAIRGHGKKQQTRHVPHTKLLAEIITKKEKEIF
jgi:hypothetical protein